MLWLSEPGSSGDWDGGVAQCVQEVPSGAWLSRGRGCRGAGLGAGAGPEERQGASDTRRAGLHVERQPQQASCSPAHVFPLFNFSGVKDTHVSRLFFLFLK